VPVVRCYRMGTASRLLPPSEEREYCSASAPLGMAAFDYSSGFPERAPWSKERPQV